MISTKYVFNTETLSYDKVELSTNEKIKKITFLTLSSLTLISAIIFLISSTTHVFVNKTSSVHRENEILKAQYSKLQAELTKTNALLQDIQIKDDSIYRRILNIDPLSSFIRRGGYGGSDRYERLRSIYSSGLLITVSKQMDYVLKQAEIQQNSYNNLLTITEAKKHKLAHIPALMPVSLDNSYLSSGFGYRMHPVFHKKIFHQGLDFSAPLGTKVYAPGNGKVIEIKFRGGYGKQIVIDHGYGYKTRYAHLNKISVTQGQSVKRGDIIGEVGTTGISTAPHLHYEVMKDDVKVNPQDYFFDDITPEIYAQTK